MDNKYAFSSPEIVICRTNLQRWYHANRKQLPWRGDEVIQSEDIKDIIKYEITPYNVLVSEAMCQQTRCVLKRLRFVTIFFRHSWCICRIATVIPYWMRWISKFPTIASLAEATESEVNAVWAGLGYYRRAQNLRKVSNNKYMHNAIILCITIFH